MAISKSITTSSSDQLIKTTEAIIGGESVNSVDARELHSFLEIKTHYSTWISRQISKYEFVINSDFSILETEVVAGGDKRKDYFITIDIAKELSMVENNDKGKQARKYFIQCEKDLKKPQLMTPAALLKEELTIFELLEVPKHLAQVESIKQVKKISGVDLSYALLVSPAQDNIKKESVMLEPTELGKQFGLSGMMMNQKLMRMGLQFNDGTGWVPTKRGAEISSKHAWAKGKKSGYNLKWNKSKIK